MVLRMRLARVSTPGGAKKHLPRYNIVLAQAQSARDSKPLEVLGTYDPIPRALAGAAESDRKIKDIKVDVRRAKYWLGVGAQPSDTVWRLLSMIGLLEPKFLPTGQQSENALKAVRFPVHEGGRPEKPPVTTIELSARRKMTERRGVAGTTSPQNPNEA